MVVVLRAQRLGTRANLHMPSRARKHVSQPVLPFSCDLSLAFSNFSSRALTNNHRIHTSVHTVRGGYHSRKCTDAGWSGGEPVACVVSVLSRM